jgi:hypothetical protein
MSAFGWLWANGRARSHPALANRESQNERQSASAPHSWAEAARLITRFAGDKPALALGAAFMAGVTLGWMIKRW